MEGSIKIGHFVDVVKTFIYQGLSKLKMSPRGDLEGIEICVIMQITAGHFTLDDMSEIVGLVQVSQRGCPWLAEMLD